MTNGQIIEELAVQIYGEDAVMNMIERGIEPPLHTLQGWASRGFKVKRGEHAVVETKLWKKKSKKNSAQEDDAENAENATDRDFYMCRAFLFKADQVEKIKEE